MRRGTVVGVSLVLALGVGAGTVGYRGRVAAAHRHAAQVQRQERRAATAVAVGFLTDWETRRYADMTSRTAAGDDPGDVYARLDRRLRTTRVTVTPGPLSADGRRLPFRARLQLAGLGELEVASEVRLSKLQRRWQVEFRSDTVYPGLRTGQQLTRSEPVIGHGELLDRVGRPVRPADPDLAANVLGVVGRTGLERVYAGALTRSPGGDVVISDPAGGTTLVKHFPPTTGSVRTTLDLGVQRAAEDALAGAGEPAAMVVLDSATGEVRAVVNRPVAGLPPAYQSEAPGSTFKVVVAAAALMHGWTPGRQVSCPATATFGGRQFVNDEPMPATMTFEQAFARSCNTAFLTIAGTLPAGALPATATLFGFGRGNLLPGAEGGSLPPPAGPAEANADVIGQGRVEASPVLLAAMAAAVASGTWRQPHLVPGPAAAVALPAGVVGPLRQLMRSVVSSGTAAGAGLPADAAGKTGTAEFGTQTPPATHAWFAGFAGRFAFCVYVERGASGGSVAAPVAARFLRAVAG